MLKDIRTYDFTNKGLEEVQNAQMGCNWPVVYLIHNKKCMYIGETSSAAYRMSQHLKNVEKKGLDVIEIVFDNEYNKSVVLDYEQRLIKYFSVDRKFNLLNKNKGQIASHDYYNRSEYAKQFPALWTKLKDMKLVKKDLDKIENDIIFKFSPFNSLSGEQYSVATQIINAVIESMHYKGTDIHTLSMVNGCAGTGKTVVAISIINTLVNAITLAEDIPVDEQDEKDSRYEERIESLKKVRDLIVNERKGKRLEIGFVIPMTGMRSTLKKVFKDYGNGLDADMIIGPNDVVKKKYDILFVDESHRLCRRKSITAFGQYDKVCEKLGLDKYKTNQLEWIIKSARHTVLFYDKDQSIKSADIPKKEFDNTCKLANPIWHHLLKTQMRCEGGDSYIQYVKDIMNCSAKSFKKVDNYDFKLFDDVDEMIKDIRQKDDNLRLCKTVSGYSWEWKTKPPKRKKIPDDLKYYDKLNSSGKYDIKIGPYKYIWNISNEDWINRQDSRYTIGCIHSTQGYDLNYCGVIFGREINYNEKTNEIEIDPKLFKDVKVKNGVTIEELKEYIINTYTTMLARGIKGCYVYAYHKELRDYLRNFIVNIKDDEVENNESGDN